MQPTPAVSAAPPGLGPPVVPYDPMAPSTLSQLENNFLSASKWTNYDNIWMRIRGNTLLRAYHPEFANRVLLMEEGWRGFRNHPRLDLVVESTVIRCMLLNLQHGTSIIRDFGNSRITENILIAALAFAKGAVGTATIQRNFKWFLQANNIIARHPKVKNTIEYMIREGCAKAPPMTGGIKPPPPSWMSPSNVFRVTNCRVALSEIIVVSVKFEELKGAHIASAYTFDLLFSYKAGANTMQTVPFSIVQSSIVQTAYMSAAQIAAVQPRGGAGPGPQASPPPNGNYADIFKSLKSFVVLNDGEEDAADVVSAGAFQTADPPSVAAAAAAEVATVEEIVPIKLEEDTGGTVTEWKPHHRCVACIVEKILDPSQAPPLQQRIKCGCPLSYSYCSDCFRDVIKSQIDPAHVNFDQSRWLAQSGEVWCAPYGAAFQIALVAKAAPDLVLLYAESLKNFAGAARAGCVIRRKAVAPLRILSAPMRFPRDMLRLKDITSSFKEVFNDLSLPSACGDCGNKLLGKDIKSAVLIENPVLWTQYSATIGAVLKNINARQLDKTVNMSVPCRTGGVLDKYGEAGARLLNGPELTTQANEVMLWHGTKPHTVPSIISSGLDPRLGNQGLYGYGTYFASELCKSLQYTDAKRQTVFLCRVVLGAPYKVKQYTEVYNLRRPPLIDNTSMVCFDSVVAESRLAMNMNGQQMHTEYVVHTTAHSYPELLIQW